MAPLLMVVVVGGGGVRYASVPVECRAAVAVGEAKAMLATYAQQVLPTHLPTFHPSMARHARQAGPSLLMAGACL